MLGSFNEVCQYILISFKHDVVRNCASVRDTHFCSYIGTDYGQHLFVFIGKGNIKKKKLLANLGHKYSTIIFACLSAFEVIKETEPRLLNA